jgi:endonuclease/exonuclease/phosphatase family metal-dependent hydrolase
MNLTILSWNIHKGFSILNSFELFNMKEALREMNADVIFLQEVCEKNDKLARKSPRWPSEAQFEFLADSYWPHFAYGKNALYPHGNHGNAILSKYPLLSWHNLDLTFHRFEQRGLLHATIQPVELKRPLHLFTTHINLFHYHRLRQIDRIAQYIKENMNEQEPFILGGDFNDWTIQLTNPLNEMLGVKEAAYSLTYRHLKTFPAFAPLLPLDRFYVRSLKPLKAHVLKGGPWNQLSDHLPIVVEVEIF